MMSRNMMSRKILIALIILVIGLCHYVQAATVSLSGLTLFSTASPRIIAMGGAYVAVADDANSIFMNPAGLGRENRPNDILINYGTLPGDIRQYCFAGDVGIVNYGRIGLGYNIDGMFGSPLYSADTGSVIGTIDYYYSEAAISYGYAVNDWLCLGAKAHRLSTGMKISDVPSSEPWANLGYSGEGYGAGFGLLLKPFGELSIGLLIDNIISTGMQYSNMNERIPPSATLGLSFKPIKEKLLLAIDIMRYNLERGGDNDVYSLGGEFAPFESVRIRIGGHFSKDDNAKYVGTPSAGLGLNIFKNIQFDYTWQRPSETSVDSHYFSLGYKF